MSTKTDISTLDREFTDALPWPPPEGTRRRRETP
jgi:hypothetical protein